ncbi:hypothetical protein IU486_24035 [Streptomyces gardneri]|uniref:hypothetical protein n=1 Tax=Nocardia TaxID=1817 RepID=UPI001359EA41|nr:MULTISPECIES: hypothetical protein [Nocardia]MBF6167805.1 hypothetical protein [Streptomyces gardneri]MBF6206178.1 hypothetical protein [Streptomyces gardneri]UAK31619.1 hypothetical protein K8O92_28290 [Nocardia asteroides]
MPHAITALILPGTHDTAAADRWDLVPVPLHGGLTLFHLTHYYTAFWQATRKVADYVELPSEASGLFPREGVLRILAADLSARPDPTFAVVFTDYFAGAGEQWATVSVAGGPLLSVSTINAALRTLGVTAAAGLDEFDTVGLSAHRSSPDYLHRYLDLCDELGV